MKLNDIKVDPKLVNEGEWVKDLPELEDLEVFVRGIDNPDYRRAQAKKIQAVPRARRQGGLDPDDQDRIMTECLYETCLKGWKNLLGDDGKEIQYSPEWAKKLMFGDEYREFRNAVLWAATQVGKAKAAATEVVRKN